MSRRDSTAADRPRILLVSPAVRPPHGGIAVLTESVERGLRQFGDVMVVATSTHRVRQPGRRVVRAGRGRAGRIVSRLRFSLATLDAASRRPDVVHAMTWRAALPVSLLPRSRRPVLVVHALGTEMLRKSALSGLLRTLVFARADEVVSISRYTAGAVHALTGRSSAVIPPSADPPAVPVRALPEDAAGPVRVLSVARLVPRKGHADLFAAFLAAREDGLSCTLTVAGGDGPERLVLEQLRRQHEADWLTVETDVSDERLAELYRSADVFALLTQDGPREFEGFGIVFAEAALAGLPVVAGASGGAREVVEDGEGGFVVTSPAEAADSIRSLCENRDRRVAMGAAARRHAEQFLPASVDGRLRRLYESAVLPRLSGRQRDC